MTDGENSALVKLVHEGDVTTILFDDAAGSNRIGLNAMRQLIRCLQVAHSSDCPTLVIRASGKDFTLGRDQKERIPGVSREESLRLILEANALLRTFPGVSICLVQGRAFGFGSGIALQSDITFATEDAEFAFDEVLHGLAPLVVAAYLPDYVGPKVAGELILTGRTVSAAEALTLRMVNYVVPVGDLEAEGRRMSGHLSSLDVGALRLMKRFTWQMRAGLVPEPEDQGVTQLARWLDAGRPAHPPAAP